MNLPTLENANVSGKRVFLRADLNVPLTKSEIRNPKSEIGIEDDTRLTAVLPTIDFLFKNNAKVILASHLGRPKGIDKSLSLEPVARWLNGHPEFISGSNGMLKSIRQAQDPESTEGQVRHDMIKTKIGGFDGWEITPKLFLLENLRFYDSEETNDEEFSKKLAGLADIYVNDAFAVSHRDNASITGVPKYLPHFAGLHLQEEVKVLSSVLENPKRPLVVIIGGAKIETKLPLVEKMRDFADYVLVGGKIANEIKSFLKEKPNTKETFLVANLNPDGLDITKESVDEFLKIIDTAATIVWNGPVGLVQSSTHSTSSGLMLSEVEASKFKVQSSGEDTERGSRELAKGILRTKAYTIVGGGDTLGFLKHLGLLDKFSFVSTGGGAMLEFLSGKKLPGLIALLF